MSDHHDRQDINDLLISYASAIDNRDWNLLRRVFTADCTADYGSIGVWNGVEEMVAFMDSAHAQAGYCLHRISNVVAEVDGDNATARSYVDALIMGVDGGSGLNAAGFYDDQLARSEAGWQIAARTFTSVRFTTAENLG